MSIKPIKGLRSYYPSDKGPVDTYQLGKNGRVEYLTAEIAVDHLSKGNDTTETWNKWAREKGVSSDTAGLILSHRLGGSGTDKTNLFPKSPNLDKTTWKEHVDAAVEEASEMRKWKKIKFAVQLFYSSDDSTRPNAIEYQYDLPSGTILYGKVNNDPAENENEEEEEEEEEEEVEEEEAEEEEEEEEKEEPVKEEVPETRARSRANEQSETPQEVRVRSRPAVEAEAPSPAPSQEVRVRTRPATEPEVPPPAPTPIVRTIVEPPTPPALEKSPSPPPPKPIEPVKVTPPIQSNDIPQAKPQKESTAKSGNSRKDESVGQQSRGVITKSDIIDLIPVVGSCKLAVETIKAAYDGNGRVALRKGIQCGISLVADFYLGRAIARHGQILAQNVTEQTIIRFVSKAENQIIIVSTFKATNQLLSTLSRLLS